MWPSWLKKRASKRSPRPSTALVAAAATPSLKDILSLLHPEPAAEPPQPAGASSPRVFHRLRVAASALRLLRALQPAQVAAWEEDEGGPLVLYFTSLEAIPRTFQDCCAVRDILRGLRATVDERDLSINGSFASELAALLPHRPKVTLPQLFVGGRHLGGAEEVRRLHESGVLARIVGPASGPAPASCNRCLGLRFVLCGSCSGSHKQFTRKSTGVGGLFRDCADCTRNGLVRCPVCFPPAA
jgi:glutaredoxin domain-containing cysteine-rich protein 1